MKIMKSLNYLLRNVLENMTSLKEIKIKPKKASSKTRCFWRRIRDLNPGAGCPTYSLSRGASSATWVILHLWRREWDSNPWYAHTYAGFQDRCLKPTRPSLHVWHIYYYIIFILYVNYFFIKKDTIFYSIIVSFFLIIILMVSS